ncbi:MAG: putative metal-binding motif-containing protein, partial [Sandaracinaceae bacterium]
MAACGRSGLDPRPIANGDGGMPDGAMSCTADLQCDDGLMCNGAEVCVGGRCAPGAPLDCDDGIDCTQDLCDEASRGCVAFPDNTRCMAGEICIAGSGCEQRICRVDADCNDGVFCNGLEQCESGFCTGGERPSCNDGQACTTDICDVAIDRCANVGADFDGDGELPIGCGGRDCDDNDPRIHPGAPELCRDGRDNDCNGLLDCADDGCRGARECACTMNEVCGNRIDDNCDGLVDCADPLCTGSPDCCGPIEFCDNGIDDNCDGRIDCADPQCAMDPVNCRCGPIEICGNGRDDDCNGLIDCADMICRVRPECRCMPTEICGNGVDDDCNGFADCSDMACAALPECRCLPVELCANGRDDDCNGLTDCADPRCAMDPSCRCGPFEICGNGLDDDCNGAIDCADPVCFGTPLCGCGPVEVCGNGLDDDCDMLIDCGDPDCAMAPACFSSCAMVVDLLSRVGPSVATGSTIGAPDTLVPSCRPGSRAGERVFSWTAPTSGAWTFDLVGSTYDTVLMVQSVCGGMDIACNDDAIGLQSQIVLTLMAGQRIVIVVDGFGSSMGTFVLNITRGAPMEVCNNFRDDDGDGLLDCADPDCVGSPLCCTPRPEVCTDGADQDCDSLIDCADPDCAMSPACCVPRPEICSNGVDDDCDFRIDCNDTDCRTNPICCVPVPEVCNDGMDQDCDLLVDCADPDCSGTPACCVPRPEICFNGRDDDCDTFTDCADSDCSMTPACCVPTPELCSDGADQDCDRLIDCADPDCAMSPACLPTCPDIDLGSMSGGIVSSGTTVGADDDFTPTCGPAGTAPDLTFTWVAPTTGTFVVTTVGSGFDTILSRRASCTGPTLACNDDAGGGSSGSVLTFFATA